MKVRAHAEDDFASFGILLRMAEVAEYGTGAVASGISDGRIEYTEADHGAMVDPLLRLTTDEAHAIYDALGVALNRAHPHADQGRADLLHERGRVDKMLDVLSDVARGR